MRMINQMNKTFVLKQNIVEKEDHDMNKMFYFIFSTIEINISSDH
jgi:hypothetical protein